MQFGGCARLFGLKGLISGLQAGDDFAALREFTVLVFQFPELVEWNCLGLQFVQLVGHQVPVAGVEGGLPQQRLFFQLQFVPGEIGFTHRAAFFLMVGVTVE